MADKSFENAVLNRLTWSVDISNRTFIVQIISKKIKKAIYYDQNFIFFTMTNL